MRSMIFLMIALAISGCSHSHAVRKPVPQSVAAWWQHLREMNRPDPYDPIEQGLRQQFMGASSRQQQQAARKYIALTGKR